MKRLKRRHITKKMKIGRNVRICVGIESKIHVESRSVSAHPFVPPAQMAGQIVAQASEGERESYWMTTHESAREKIPH